MARELHDVVLDLSHHNTVVDAHLVDTAGIKAVVHKATQGADYVDQTLAGRRLLFKGLVRFGTYHFLNQDSVPKQVDNYLAHTAPGELMVLDWEAGGAAPIEYAIEFATLIHDKTGKLPVLYSYQAFLKGQTGLWGLLPHCPLWIARYSRVFKPVIPKVWTRWDMWQHTDKGHCPGIYGYVDRSFFDSEGGRTLDKLWTYCSR